MDLKDLSLPGIYSSIEFTLERLQQQTTETKKEIEVDFDAQNVIENVLKPACEVANMENVEDLRSLKKLHALNHSTQQPPSPVPTESTFIDKNIELPKTTPRSKIHFPQVQLKPPYLPTSRPLLSSGVRYPAINHLLTVNSNGLKPLLPSTHLFNKTCIESKRGPKLHLHEELGALVDHLEKQISKFQKMFTLFSQKILLPLQTFCKHTKTRVLFKNKFDVEERIPHTTELPENLHQCEFFIVELMNKLRQLLWPPAGGDAELHLTKIYPQMLSLHLLTSECERFQIIKLVPDVIEKFSLVLNYARLWLKRDQLYTENAKSGFQRATRRYKKSERLWREARHTHRQLSNEENQICCEIETNGFRLETLHSDIETLAEDLSKCCDIMRSIEAKFDDTDDSSDFLKNQRKALRRKINFLTRKIEVKKRSFDFMKSRIFSLKADRDEIQEKIRINKKLSDSLQEALSKLSRHKDAWKRRYVEKTDAKLMRKKVESVGLRIPSPTVREKTFVLKTRRENLQEAIEIVSDRLSESSIHWSVLCCHLSWPNQFVVTLQNINRQVSQKEVLEFPSSLTSGSSALGEKLPMPNLNQESFDVEMSPVDRIIDFVNFRTRGNTEKEQCVYMLHLWLHHNGQLASLELLVKALQASRLSDTATRLSKLSSR